MELANIGEGMDQVAMLVFVVIAEVIVLALLVIVVLRHRNRSDVR